MRKKFDCYHGTPITGTLKTDKCREEASVSSLFGVEYKRKSHATEKVFETYMKDRNVLIPFLNHSDLKRAKRVCNKIILDNSAFTAHTQGVVIDWNDYYDWVAKHEDRIEWFIIPDVIDGTEEENDKLIRDYHNTNLTKGYPVWHLNESLERLKRLADNYDLVCFGSSGEFWDLKSEAWRGRVTKALEAISIDGIPITQIHMLRCLDINIFPNYPFDSGDSTNFAQNHHKHTSRGKYPYPMLRCESYDTPKKISVSRKLF